MGGFPGHLKLCPGDSKLERESERFMIRSMFAAVAGLRVHQNRLDVVSNNIANVNTYGFKPGRANFKESIYQNTYNSSAGNNVYGGQNPSQVGYGAQLSAISLDFRPGTYEPTGQGTDCMIAGNGFFMVGTKDLGVGGLGSIVNQPSKVEGTTVTEANTDQLTALNLTRVGSFTIDGDGYLVDENRNVVYGFYQKGGINVPAVGTKKFEPDTETLQPLRVPSLSVEGGSPGDDPNAVNNSEPRLKLNSISIDANGVISGTADSGIIYKFGQIALCNVTNPNALEKIGDSYYQIRNNTGEIGGYPPGEGTTGSLITAGLEMSKTDLAQEITNMIIAERGLQANSKMITVSDEVLQELINMKR